jgi:hypothetical protein
VSGAADPCCSVVSLDEANGMVVLPDNKSGKPRRALLLDRSFEPCLDQARTHDCQPCPDSH